MNEKFNKLDGKGVIPKMLILSIVCLIVGLSFILVPYFTNGNNMKAALDIWGRAYIYYLAIILLAMLPFYLKDLKKRGVASNLMKHEIIDKHKIVSDISLGLLAGILSLVIVALISSLTPLKGISSSEKDPTPFIIQLVTLVIIAPVVKEIVFRLYSKLFLEEKYGILPAVLINNIIFGIFDWHTMGLSFIAGIIWYLFYIKRRRLIVPMIAHATINLIPIVCTLFSH